MIYFGLDLGQASDYTALTAVEKIQMKDKSIQYHTRHAERFQLGTSYPKIIDKIEDRINAINIINNYMVVVDATGVGRPVVDLMRKREIRIVPVIITAGNNELYDMDFGGWHVPKKILISMLQVLLQNGQLKFAKACAFTQTLIEELLNFRIKIGNHANDKYESWREGDHDDLVLSLAMAVWYAERYGKVEDNTKMQVPNPWLEIASI